MTPEFSRPERIDQIGSAERTVAIVADDAERAALARRFGLLSIERLEGRFAVRAEAGGVLATGIVSAAVTQACVATGEPVPATVDEPVSLRFVEQFGGGEDELELAADALDTLLIEGGAIDLGEAAAETMALALDPFPRSPSANATLAEMGVRSEDEVEPEAEAGRNPFGALADLKRKLEGE